MPSKFCMTMKITVTQIGCAQSPHWNAAIRTAGTQQMMMHLDLEVSDLAASVAHALELGAILPDFQPQEDVRVLLDPAGHPFCLWVPR